MKKSITLLIYLVLSVPFFSCGDTKNKAMKEEEVITLSNRIISLINYLDNVDSCRKGVQVLDSATAIDKDCFTCYSNKIIFQNALKNYQGAITSINHCIRLRPDVYDLYLRGGVFYEKTGDTVSSNKYLREALRLCLEKINHDQGKTFKEQGDYDWYVVRIDQAIILKLLQEKDKADTLLKTLYSINPTYPQDTTDLRKSILFLLNSDKKQVLDSTFM